MSGALALLNSLASWRNLLRPASFRGVAFQVDGSKGQGGRRLVTHEYPLRDEPFTEDLGRKPRRYRFPAWVVGDDYMAQRDALIAAIENSADAATLVHPYLGERTCRAGLLSWEESKSEGGHCRFELEFVEDGAQPSPIAGGDTASGLLSGLVSMAQTISAAYQAVSLVISDPAAVLGLAGGLLGGLAGDLLGLPASTIDLLGNLAAAVALTPFDDLGTADAVQAWFAAAGNNVLTAQQASTTPTDAVTGLVAPVAPSADLTGGLAALASWGASLAAPAGLAAIQAAQALFPPSPGAPLAVQQAQAAQQAAIVALAQGSAVAAVLTVYASTDFPTSDAASAARTQAVALIDVQIEAAAQAGQDDLYRGWRAVQALASIDLITRAQSLPTLAAYALPFSLPSLALAQRFYQDPARSDELEALNDVPHPLFMPFDGVKLNA